MGERLLFGAKDYDNVRKITAGQGDGYTTGLLYYPFFKEIL